MQDNKKDKELVCGHRQRLKNRYFECGIDALSEHEMLEFLLFYSIPRRDTKPLAKKLLLEYGSIEAVITASSRSLELSGLSRNTIIFFKYLSDLELHIQRNKVHGQRVDSFNQLGNYFLRELEKDPTERMVMLLLDGKNSVISFETVCVGGFSATNINMRKITELALLRMAAKVVVAHNHPSGVLRASMQDYVATKNVEYILSQMDIELVEHFIVTPDGFIGIKNERNKENEINQAQAFSGYDYADNI